MAKTWFVNTNKFPFVLVTRGYDKGYRVQCLGLSAFALLREFSVGMTTYRLIV